MTRAVTIAELGDTNVFSVDGTNNRVGIGSTQPTEKLDVAGVVVATAFTGDGTGLTGVAATFTGVLTYEDVTNVDSTGIVTARAGLNVVGGGATVTGVSTFHDTVRVGSAITLGASSGIVTATGVNVTGIVTLSLIHI